LDLENLANKILKIIKIMYYAYVVINARARQAEMRAFARFVNGLHGPGFYVTVKPRIIFMGLTPEDYSKAMQEGSGILRAPSTFVSSRVLQDNEIPRWVVAKVSQLITPVLINTVVKP
jgi:hypothetical protein